MVKSAVKPGVSKKKPDAETQPVIEKQPVAKPRILQSLGMQFPLDAKFISPRTARLLQDNLYEEREANAVSALVRPEDVAMEIGAGIGFMSTLMALQRRAKHVHAYEANPSMIPYIKRVHRMNRVLKKVTVTNALLGAEAGEITFYERKHFSASSIIAEPAGETSPVIAEHRVPVLNVADEMRRIAPTVLVCDIEGAEADLVPRMDLSSVRVAVVELHPQWIGRDGVLAVFEAFHRSGLIFFCKTSNKKVATFRRDW